MVRTLAYTWAAPTTLVGLTAGALTMATGGKVQRRRGALEFHGGFSRWFLMRRSVMAQAMTLGHVIIGRDECCLDNCRDHEQAHVRQVERWGGAFLPAYVLASAWAWSRGEHYYLDNWFERDARRACGDPGPLVTIEDLPPMPKPTPTPTPLGDARALHATLHVERHFTSSAFVRDVVIGMADGLTVPFALAAGLSGANVQTSIIVTAGLAEIAAGSIAMGLGGYLAARSEAEHYVSEKRREEREVETVPEMERDEVAGLFRGYGLTDREIEPILRAFQTNPPAWVDFMMRHELGLEEPDPRRALNSALTIAGAYVAGGLIPLAPYMILAEIRPAQVASVGVTLTALTIFGYIKGRFTGSRPLRGAWQTALIGGLAAAAAFLIARMFS
jgi:VIT1/CCC1 family predicted Fe2+/Mn2+ transporter